VGRFINQDDFLGDVSNPPSIHRFMYAHARPTFFVDPSGRAVFFDEKGNQIGADGKPDEDVFFVVPSRVPNPEKPGKTMKNPELERIKKTTKKKEFVVVEEQRSAVQLPPREVREELVAAVERSDAPSATDPVGGFHEEGGVFAEASDGRTIVIPAQPGDAADPAVDTHAEIDVFNSKDPALWNDVGADGEIRGTYHVHPSGTREEVVGPQQSAGSTSFGATKRSKAFFGHPDGSQGPSGMDFDAARVRQGQQHIVVGARDDKVYFHDEDRVLVTFPVEQIVDPEKKK